MAVRAPVLVIRGSLRREDLPGLYARACRLLRASEGARLWVNVTGVTADAVSVDALARLQLAARRHGCRVVLEGADHHLRELVAMVGLEEVLVSPNEAGARTEGTAARYPGRT